MKKTAQGIAFLLLAACILLAGCGSGVKSAGTAPQEIVVLRNEAVPDSAATKDGGLVTKIDILENVGIADWLDDRTLICTHENTGLENNSGYHPINLWTYNIDTKEETLFKSDGSRSLNTAQLSQDKKFAFYTYSSLDPSDPASYSTVKLPLYLTDLTTKEEIFLSESILFAEWSGNTLIYGADGSTDVQTFGIGAHIYSADTAGNVTRLVTNEGDHVLFNAALAGEKLFYIDSAGENRPAGELCALDPATGEKTILLSNVLSFAPSPDENSALVVIKTDAGKKLAVIGLDGTILTEITEQKDDIQMIRAWWSPDQSRIVYSLFKGYDNSENAVYLYDVPTGETSSIAVVMNDVYAWWSPSGDKLAISFLNMLKQESRILYLK